MKAKDYAIRDRIIFCVLGLAFGLMMIFAGIFVMNPETHLLGTRDELGSLIQFGGDFQTEIYAMTYSVGHQVQKAYVYICRAIGWLIIGIGGFDICYFGLKLHDYIIEHKNQSVEASKSHKYVATEKLNPSDKNNASDKTNADKNSLSDDTVSLPMQPKKSGTATQPTEQEQLDGYWICEKCRTKNLLSRTSCWSCDFKR
jgi:hypothetical protein